MKTRFSPTTRPVSGFPSISLRTQRHAAPVDVTLIAQLPPGGGSRLVRQAAVRQRGHAGFIDALDEPSVKLAGVNPQAGEHSSLYSFVVGEGGHPFHRHAGSRVFTAVSGSPGTQLRFSGSLLANGAADADAFVASLHLIQIPPDCLFTVRFAGQVWHQFVSADPASGQPALFALSCHPDEAAGLESEELRLRVQADEATIPMLTEVLPAAVQVHVDRVLTAGSEISRFWLSLAAPPLSWRSRFCHRLRTWYAGRAAPSAVAARARDGFSSWSSPEFRVERLPGPATGSLLWREWSSSRIDHQDLFRCRMTHESVSRLPASELLDRLLQSFLDRPSVGVSGLMMLRNALVRPLGLRRSRLGCPVSSLLSDRSSGLFAGRNPVLAQRSHSSGRQAEVVLGADDRHLRFRTAVIVEIEDDGSVVFSMGTVVECLNAFGRFYMSTIAGIHRRYVAPTMLRVALADVLLSLRDQPMSASAA